MDLGKAKLLRTGLNALHQAIHPVHGIAWTDGKQVCLTYFVWAGGEAVLGDTNIIGQFEHVYGLHWGPHCCPESPALLAVQHRKHVTVWQLQLSTLEQSNLLCTQTCQISEPFPLLPQGCFWHPKTDVLAVLSRHDASVFFLVRVDNQRVKASIPGDGPIRCGCWTKDGMRLVVAVGSALHSYTWNDIQKSLVPCTFCPIFDIGGTICAVESTEGPEVAVATELPLDKICSLNAGWAFEVPAGTEYTTAQSPVHTLVDDSCPESRRRSVASESLSPFEYLSSLPSSPIDLTQILAKHRRSDPSPLIHLKCRDHLTGSGQDCSHLILVRYDQKVTTTRRVSIPGVLVPDILAFDLPGSTVAVASNACNMVLVYRVTASNIPNIQRIELEKNERAKGVCFISDSVLLLMVGKQKPTDATFLPSSSTDKYDIRLVFRELTDDRERGISPAQSQDSGAGFLGTRRHSETVAKEDCFVLKELKLPGGSIAQVPSDRSKLVEEVQGSEPSPAESLADVLDMATAVAAKSFCVESNRLTGSPPTAGHSNRESSRPASARFLASDKLHCNTAMPQNSASLKEELAEQLALGMERICVRFAEVQQSLCEILDFTRNGRKLTGGYPAASEPPYINIIFQKQVSDTVVLEKKQVLLCDGKLSLCALQHMFGLRVLEMMHGSSWIVLVADVDGFIPLTFRTRDELVVRSGEGVLSAGSPCCTDRGELDVSGRPEERGYGRDANCTVQTSGNIVQLNRQTDRSQ